MDSDVTRVIISMIVLYGALLSGYGARHLRPGLTAITPRILRFCLLTLDVPLMVIIFWMLDPQDRANAWKLPLIGFILSVFLMFIGIFVARTLRMTRLEEGAFAAGASMSNTGFSFGGLLCLMILGVNAATLSQAYSLYLTPFTFLIMFQVAAWYVSGSKGLGTGLGGFFKDVTRWLPLAGMVVGILLNVFAPRPPKWFETVVTVWVLVATGTYSFAIGASVFVTRIREHMKPCLMLSGLKFVATPMLALVLVQLFDLSHLQRQVVFIESAMPMAIFAVVVAGLTGLARDLANSCWIFTTLATLPLVAPIYIIVTRWIP